VGAFDAGVLAVFAAFGAAGATTGRVLLVVASGGG
jgi:hypothetical protein